MIDVKRLSKGDYIVYRDMPYLVKGIGSKITGTHSHTVTKIELEGLFDKNRETITRSPHEKIEDIEIVRRLGQYIAPLKDNMVQVMSMDSYEIFDAEVLPEVMPGISDGCSVTYIEFRGERVVVEVRK